MTPTLHHSSPLRHSLSLQLRACQPKSRRNGKVARLPLELRQQINRMLEDGVEYKVIIKNLGAAGQHLTEHNISNWRLGGYQDYLKAQLINDRARTQTETAADLVRQEGHLDPAKLQQVCREMALLHYLDTIIEHGEQLARDSLKKNPAKFITLMNACCNMSNTTLAIEKRNSLQAAQPHEAEPVYESIPPSAGVSPASSGTVPVQDSQNAVHPTDESGGGTPPELAGKTPTKN